MKTRFAQQRIFAEPSANHMQSKPNANTFFQVNSRETVLADLTNI